MGGDQAPEMVIAGAALARVRYPEVRFLLFGDEARIGSLAAAHPALAEAARIVHTPDAVSNEEKPSIAIRQGRQSSMWLAIQAVKDGQADGVVSAGNTGALMAMSKLILRTLPGIDRPAIASIFPTERGESVMLDLGANVECDARHLVQFAVMGEVFARCVLGIERPSVALLNIGEEDVKGHAEIRAAADTLDDAQLPITFTGFVEGNDLPAGTVDVVVTDGFTGNVALKVAEGTARLYSHFLRRAFANSLLARLGYVLARNVLRQVSQRTDPRYYNGAMFLGLNGVVVKSHGGTDAIGFANAVGVAVDLLRHGANEQIGRDYAALGSALDADKRAAAQ
ncbi:MAG: phosphate acyltransferase PlsX [Alphaproteobacteria bacterium]